MTPAWRGLRGPGCIVWVSAIGVGFGQDRRSARVARVPGPGRSGGAQRRPPVRRRPDAAIDSPQAPGKQPARSSPIHHLDRGVAMARSAGAVHRRRRHTNKPITTRPATTAAIGTAFNRWFDRSGVVSDGVAGRGLRGVRLLHDLRPSSVCVGAFSVMVAWVSATFCLARPRCRPWPTAPPRFHRVRRGSPRYRFGVRRRRPRGRVRAGRAGISGHGGIPSLG